MINLFESLTYFNSLIELTFHCKAELVQPVESKSQRNKLRLVTKQNLVSEALNSWLSRTIVYKIGIS